MSQCQKGKQVLLLNTNHERLTFLEKLLKEQTELSVFAANTTQMAISILRNQAVDYVVSNINLDNFDGWRLARMIRSGVLKCSSETPFILVANTWCEHIARTTAREFGINQLIAFSDANKLPTLLQDNVLLPIEDMKKSSLLVVEDNPDTRHLVSRILSARFTIDTAENGEQGLALWHQNKYDLVLLDVMLPGISGNQVLDEIMQENPAQSVVIMTANHTMELAEELMLNGAADFVTKPFRAEQLRAVCESAARREDFIISNKQFADKVKSLNESRLQYQKVSQQHQQLLDQIGSVIIELDHEGKINFLNKAWERFTGFSIENTVQSPLVNYIDVDNSQGLRASDTLNSLLQQALRVCTFEFKIKNNFSAEIWVEAKFEMHSNKVNDGLYISGTIDNITSRMKAQQDLEYLAIHDGLTGLYNRVHFENELKQLTANAAIERSSHVLFYVDLDRFKVINDTLGHQHGDVVLRNIASLISKKLRDVDFIARIGGDEFAIILPNTLLNSAIALANNICQFLDAYKCEIEGQIFKINCSIGIAEINGEYHDSQEYMKHADIALYAAKKMGRNMAHIYDQNDSISKELQASLEWTQTIHQAVADDNLVLYFQPIYHIASREIAYYEALVRLELDGEIIMPGEFIPALEREGDMSLLDRQVISKAISYLAKYPSLNKIAINLSAQGFSDERLIPLLQEKLSAYDVDASRIIFELTESASLSDLAGTLAIIERLSQLGCDFSIDDFGTGFSTFSYLKQLPAQSVKIDGSFIVDLANNSVDLALVKAIYEVANALGKKTVAEFVENEQTLELLAKIGVTYAQGYHLSKPKPVHELF